MKSVNGGVPRGAGGYNAPGAENIVASTFFNTVNLLPKELRFENGSAKLVFLPRAP